MSTDNDTVSSPAAVEADIADHTDSNSVEILDLLDPVGRLHSHMPLFEIYCANLAANLTVVLESYLGRPLSITAEKPRLGKFDPILPVDETPVFDRLYRLDGVNSLVATVAPIGLTYRLVDVLFGGKGDMECDESERVLSPTENNMLDTIANAMTGALIGIIEATTKPDKPIEYEPWSVQQAAQEGHVDEMVAIPMQLILGEYSGPCELWFSLSILENILGVNLVPSLDIDTAEPQWMKLIKDQVFNCELDLKCTLTEMLMPLNRISCLAPGDFIPIADISEATFSIEKIPLFKAKVGVSNDQASASFIRWI